MVGKVGRNLSERREQYERKEGSQVLFQPVRPEEGAEKVFRFLQAVRELNSGDVARDRCRTASVPGFLCFHGEKSTWEKSGQEGTWEDRKTKAKNYFLKRVRLRTRNPVFSPIGRGNFCKGGSAMYLHLGSSVVIHQDDILGIFDLDNTTWSRHTRDFLSLAELEGRVVSIGDDLPKSFTLCQNKAGKSPSIFLSFPPPRSISAWSPGSLRISNNRFYSRIWRLSYGSVGKQDHHHGGT